MRRILALLLVVLAGLTPGISRAQVSYTQVSAAAEGVTCNGSTDDTKDFQKAISDAEAMGYGTTLVVPPGTCVLSSTLSVNLTGTSSLTIVGDSMTTTILDFKFPANAANFDGLDVTIGNGDVNHNMWRDNNNSGGAFAINGVDLIQDTPANHPAGTGIKIIGQEALGPTTFPEATLTNIGMSGPGNQGYNGSGWLNGIWLTGYSLQNVNINNFSLYGPQSNSCTATQPEIGYTSDCYVAGAPILVTAPNNGGQQFQGVSVAGFDAKSGNYVTDFALSGQLQGTSFSGNIFGSKDGVEAGGGIILDQLAGPPVQATVSGATFTNLVLASSTTGITAGMSFVPSTSASGWLNNAYGTFVDYVGPNQITETINKKQVTGYPIFLATPGWEATGTNANDTCTLQSGSTSYTSACSVKAGSGIVQISNLTGSLSSTGGWAVSDASHLIPASATVRYATGASSGFLQFGLAPGSQPYWGNFDFQSASAQFTNGIVLTAPYPTSSSIVNSGCSVARYCAYAPTDPLGNSSFPAFNLALSGINVLGTDFPGANPAFLLSGSSDSVTNSSFLAGGSAQQFLEQIGGSVDVTGDTIGAATSNLQPQINLLNGATGAVYDNTISGGMQLGTGTGASTTWGINYVGGQTLYGSPAASTNIASALSEVAVDQGQFTNWTSQTTLSGSITTTGNGMITTLGSGSLTSAATSAPNSHYARMSLEETGIPGTERFRSGPFLCPRRQPAERSCSTARSCARRVRQPPRSPRGTLPPTSPSMHRARSPMGQHHSRPWIQVPTRRLRAACRSLRRPTQLGSTS